MPCATPWSTRRCRDPCPSGSTAFMSVVTSLITVRVLHGGGPAVGGGRFPRRTRPQTPQAPSEGRVPRHPPEHRPCPAGHHRPRRGPRASTPFATAAPAPSRCATALRRSVSATAGWPPRWRANGAPLAPRTSLSGLVCDDRPVGLVPPRKEKRDPSRRGWRRAAPRPNQRRSGPAPRRTRPRSGARSPPGSSR